MAYNIHPILVHFPIALLFLYSVIKILPFEKWLPNISWLQIQRFLLLIGVLGIFGALQTGEIAEELTRANSQLVEMHALFANATAWFYGLLLTGEILAFLNIKIFTNPKYSFIANYSNIINILASLQKLINHKILSKVLALFGLISITITGLLGGVIVYGTTADPLAGTVLKLLGISL